MLCLNAHGNADGNNKNISLLFLLFLEKRKRIEINNEISTIYYYNI